MEQAPWAASNHHLFVVRLQTEVLRVDRDTFLQALQAEGIQASLHFLPLHTHPFYQPYYHRQGSPPLPATEALGQSVLSLPIFPGMDEKDVEDVIEAMEKLLQYYAR
jgi:dTDP-4-amino-4,6-dideoxygalactose transaminase